jgi:acetyl esterase/lipase
MGIAIIPIIIAMNRLLLSRFSKGFLATTVSLLVLAAACQPAQAVAQEPSELFATADDGTPLHWTVYTPDGTGPWPAVLIIHGGTFKGGTPTSSPESVTCGRDLAAAGYIAFSVEYRLAAPGRLEGQVSDGHFPDQPNDIRLAVLAARFDSRCNGQVGSVGGSAGGYETAFMAGTGTAGVDRLDVGISLSGVYDCSDFSPDPNIGIFTKNVLNYLDVTISETDALRAASPVYLVDSNTAPLFLVNTEGDPMPFSQLGDMTDALDALGVTNYQALTLPGDLHSFGYWGLVKEQALAFLAAGFAGVPPPPLPTPTPSPTSTPEPSPDATPTPPPVVEPAPSQMLLNVSTRVRVDDGASVMIGGFIITGDTAKKVVLRAIGPSLANVGVPNALSDPVLELYDSAGRLIAQNNDCSSLPPSLIPDGFEPPNGKESLITATLPAGAYTAVLRGVNGASGVGLFELFDLDQASSRLSNISTRGDVGLGNEVMIGGFIIGGDEPTKVIVRALGPSLAASGISDPLPNPSLELYDSNGSLIFANDDWRASQAQEIADSGFQPSDEREAAMIATLAPGSYTAILHDAAAESGIALIEVYNLKD